jgi:hypothetical protein
MGIQRCSDVTEEVCRLEGTQAGRKNNSLLCQTDDHANPDVQMFFGQGTENEKNGAHTKKCSRITFGTIPGTGKK